MNLRIATHAKHYVLTLFCS